MNKRGGNFGLGTGGASILLIFVLLCLTTFATLSIVSANADYKLTQRNAQAVAAYYAADLEANELLAQINQALLQVEAGNAEGDITLGRGAEFCRTALDGMEGIVVEDTATGALVRYAVPVDETRELRVALEVWQPWNAPPGATLSVEPNNPNARTFHWSIAAWQTASTEEWVESNSIELWDGGPAGLAALPEGLAELPAE